MNEIFIYIVSGFGFFTLLGVFYNMKPGFGVYNLRAVGIILISTFSCLLALNDPKILSAAIGILGATAGYLFGAVETKKTDASSFSANESKFGDNAKVAGRDINETIEKVQGSISKIENAIINQSAIFKKSTLVYDFLICTIYKVHNIDHTLGRMIMDRQRKGWMFFEVSSGLKGSDIILVIFRKESSNKEGEIVYDIVDMLL